MGSPIPSPARHLLPVAALLLGLLACAGPASASLDTFALGDGHEGPVQVTTSSPLNYSAPLAAAASAGSSALLTGPGRTGASGSDLTTGSADQAQFEDGRLVMVIQSAGSLAGATSGAPGPFDLSASSIGRWEFARVASVTGDLVTGMSIALTAPLEHAYSTNGAQVVAIPEFTDVSIGAGATWSANAWDGQSGGVTAFLASGEVDLAGTSGISASGAGFRGGELHNAAGAGCTQLDGAIGGGKGEGVSFGAYPGTSASNASRGNLANGAGGGDCSNAGGGGGGNAGPGGRGGFSFDGDRDVGGMGGSALGYSAIGRAVFGGGGGAGDSNNANGGAGGAGGGLVFVRGAALTGAGSLSANGAPGDTSAAEAAGDGAGGGGAGGVVYARFAGSADCSIASAAGGHGGDEPSDTGVHGPGGGGGGGRVLLQSATGSCATATGNGAAGVAVNNASSNRGAQPASADDPAFSGTLEQISGGFTTPTATVLEPSDGDSLASTTPTLSGSSSAAFAEIRIALDGSEHFTATADPSGDWSFTFPSPLNEGAHSFTIQPVASGIAGEMSPEISFDVDVTPPDAPSVTGPASPSPLDEADIAFSAGSGTDHLACSLDNQPESPCPASPVTVGPLTDGEHSFNVVAYDEAGNSASASAEWTVDTLAPTVEISAPETASVSGPNLSVLFTVADAGAVETVECSLDSGSFTECSSPLVLTNLESGPHSVAVRATDEAGNPTTVTRNWVVDATPPDPPEITDPEDGTTTADSTPTVSGSAESLAEIVIYDDDLEIGSTDADGDGAWSWTVSPPLSDGAHHFTAIARDAVGNESEPSASIAVTIDATAPDPPVIESPASGPIADVSPVFSGTAEAGSTVRLTVDSVQQTQTTVAGPGGAWSLSLDSSLANGEHTITAHTTDALGNTSPASAEVNLTVDTVVPAVAITYPADGALINDDSPQIVFTAEAGAQTRCHIDEESYESCTSPFATSDLTEGEHTAYVEAKDAAGNTAVATSTFTVDTIRPTVTIDAGPASGSYTNDTSPAFEFSADEPSDFECALDSFSFASCTSPASPELGASPEGEHTFHVRAVDAAGNYSVISSRTWTVDTTAPAAPEITLPTNNAAVQTAQPVVSGTAEPYATVQVSISASLSGSAPVDAGGDWTFTTDDPLGDAIYDYDAVAVDRAGNVSPVSQIVHIRVDAADPTATIQSKPGALANSSTSTFNFTADEAATFKCSLDASPLSDCSSPVLLSGLPDGLHTFAVVAKDVSGHDSSATSWTWRIDTTGPVVTVTQNSPPAGVSPIFTFSPNEPVAMYRCRIDGAGAFVSCSSPHSAPTLPIGDHTLELRATDFAGNTSQKSVPFSVKSTSVPPPPGPTDPTGPTACTVDGESVVPASVAITAVRAAKKKVTFTVRTDRYALVHITIRQNGKLVSAGTGPVPAGARSLSIALKRTLARGKTFTVRLSAVTLAGGKSAADAKLSTSSGGRLSLAPVSAGAGTLVQSSIDCAAEARAKRAKVSASVAGSPKASSGVVRLKTRSSDWTIAAIRLIQGTKTFARRTLILRPGKAVSTSLKTSKGLTLAKGRADVQITTFTADGVRQSLKRQFSLK